MGLEFHPDADRTALVETCQDRIRAPVQDQVRALAQAPVPMAGTDLQKTKSTYRIS